MNPMQWTNAENEAWHKAIPNLQKSFTDLMGS